jgi:hypothetical protein
MTLILTHIFAFGFGIFISVIVGVILRPAPPNESFDCAEPEEETNPEAIIRQFRNS